MCLKALQTKCWLVFKINCTSRLLSPLFCLYRPPVGWKFCSVFESRHKDQSAPPDMSMLVTTSSLIDSDGCFYRLFRQTPEHAIILLFLSCQSAVTQNKSGASCLSGYSKLTSCSFVPRPLWNEADLIFDYSFSLEMSSVTEVINISSGDWITLKRDIVKWPKILWIATKEAHIHLTNIFSVKLCFNGETTLPQELWWRNTKSMSFLLL